MRRASMRSVHAGRLMVAVVGAVTQHAAALVPQAFLLSSSSYVHDFF